MEHKLSKAQIEAKTYIENNSLEKIIGDMLNALVYSKDPYPTVFMIKYLANLASSNELADHGISISSVANTAKSEPRPIEVTMPTVVHQPQEEVQEVRKASTDDSAADIRPSEIPKAFPKFPEGSRALVVKYLTEELWDRFLNIKTRLDHDLSECISVTLEKSENEIGIFAADGESYEIYKEVFLPVIEELHGWSRESAHQSQVDPDKFSCVNLDEEAEVIKSMVLSVERNLLGFSFPIALSGEERISVQRKVQEILDPYVDSSLTKIDDSRVGEADTNILENFNKKYLGTEFCREWPEGRGVVITDDLLVAVNLENHVQISSRVNNGDLEFIWKKVMTLAQSLNNRFEFSSSLGYLTSSPESLGTGLVIKISLYVPELIRENREFNFKDVKSERVGEDIVVISNAKSIGVLESDIVMVVQDAAKKIVEEEKKIRTQKSGNIPKNEEVTEINDVKENRDEEVRVSAENIEEKTVEEAQVERKEEVGIKEEERKDEETKEEEIKVEEHKDSEVEAINKTEDVKIEGTAEEENNDENKII